MNKDIVLLDLFSGIGGFSKGLTDAGFNITKHFFSEIDKHAIAVYKYQFKNSEYVGSVTTLDGRAITRPNIITFGSPCQDFSVAGKRAGMEGQRSSLIGEALRLITECRPDVFIWENVKGVFSSNSGADFWAIIQAFANIGGYRLEWELVNTKWVLPQNRERIYLIGHLAEGSSGFVFPFREDDYVSKSSTEVNSSNRRIAPTLQADYYKTPTDGQYLSVVAQRGRGEENIQQLEERKDGSTNTLTGVQKDNLILMTEHDDKFRFYRDDEKKSGIQGMDIFKETAKVIDIIDNHPKNIQVCDYRSDEGLRVREDGLSPTLQARAREDKWGMPMVIQSNPCLESGGKQPYQQNRVYEDYGIAPAIMKEKADLLIANTVTPDAYLARGERNRDENGKAVLTSMHDRRIRRLTEIECERLQGFHDNWTEYGNYDGVVKMVAKTQRYKMLGNAVTVRVVEEIGKRLLAL
jgi:DNA (cytosine-5)-methyltransferase 1